MTDRIALVTGASRGFGYAVARALAARGIHVLALARTVGGLEDLADEIDRVSGSCTLVPADITDDPALARMGRAIYDRWGRLDLMIHAAAHAAPCAPAQLTSDKDLDRSIAVNLRGTQRLIYMCDPLLKAAPNGCAVIITDSRAGAKFFAAYGASKAAAKAIGASWAAECAAIGPTVTLFEPKPMATALRARFYPGEDRSKLAAPRDEAERLLAALGEI